MRSPYEGKLIRLRAREPEDETYLYEWFNDPEVTRFVGTRYPESRAQARKRLQPDSRFGWSVVFLIETLAEGDPIGQVALGSGSAEDRSARVGITIGDKTRWDGGYGTDTMRTVCRFGFEMMNLHRIELDVQVENERAAHVYTKIGFKEEARCRDRYFKEGMYDDALVMGLLKGELIDG